MITDQDALALHQRAACGETLSEEQQAQLEAWYTMQDRLESQDLGQDDRKHDIEKLQAQIDTALTQLHTMTARMQVISSENDTLRQEIAYLRRQLSQRTQFQTVR